MSGRRVVITGMGWVTPLGDDLEGVWSSLVRGYGAVSPIERFDASTFPTNFAAQVKNFDLARALGHRAQPFTRAGRSTQMALAAAWAAWRQAGLDRGGVDVEGVGIYLGGGDGEPDFDNVARACVRSWRPEQRAADAHAWATTALAGADLWREVEQEPNMAHAHIAALLGCRGPSYNCMTACAAGTQAVGEAFELIARGDADAMLAGGAHSMIHPLGMTGFIRLTAMSVRRDQIATAARPFDQTRDGFVMGEGAGILVLEELEHARRRGALILAEVAGHGSSADAFRITDIQPQGQGAAAAMRRALRQAGIDPREAGADGRPPVHYISAHGTGTQENDKIETLAVKEVFGPLAPKVPFSSVKSMLGHLIQAAGAVELMTCVMALRTGIVPPTMNLKTPDPACDLDYVPNASRDLNAQGGVKVCLSNSFGFGGQNNAIVVRRPEGA